MNEHCECDGPGFCNRHIMNKNDVLFNMCKGRGNCDDCGLKYWIGWERGRLGATKPKKPILEPENFCDKSSDGQEVECKSCSSKKYIQRFYNKSEMTYIRSGSIQRANQSTVSNRSNICSSCPFYSNDICGICGCDIKEKTAQNYESCPIGKWFPETRSKRKFEDKVKTNLLMHIMPVQSNSNWKMNLDNIATRIGLFNNKKLLAICVENKKARQKVNTVDPEEVLDYCHEIGLYWDEVKAYRNDPKIREGVSFPWLLKSVKSLDPNEISFYCHGKGSTHNEESITAKWADAMYRICLDGFDNVKLALENFAMAGPFRRFGQFTTPGNHRWHYSGTFYWFRNDEVFRDGKDWTKLDNQFFCVESWPGRMFRPHEVVCLLGDDYQDLYNHENWLKIDEQIDQYILGNS